MRAITSRVRETAVGVSEARAIPAPAETPGPLSLAAEAIGGVSGLANPPGHHVLNSLGSATACESNGC